MYMEKAASSKAFAAIGVIESYGKSVLCLEVEFTQWDWVSGLAHPIHFWVD